MNITNIDYFLEWGGKSWKKLFLYSLQNCLNNDLNGKKILELGPRYGKISCFFGLQGAEVLGIDRSDEYINLAKLEAEKHGISNTVSFFNYNSNFDLIENNYYDIIFTKSVLVMINKNDFEKTISELSKKLKKDGKIIFIENAYGNFIFNLLRRIKHTDYNASYFRNDHLEVIKKYFNIKSLKKNLFPPIYAIFGIKK